METYFEVGQTVYCSVYGKGTVKRITTSIYPIDVYFESQKGIQSYTWEGKYKLNANCISLSQNPIPPIINTPLIKFKEGELVFAYIVDFWMLCHYYQPVGTFFAVYKSFQKEKLLYAREVRKITDIPLPLKL